MSPTLKLWLKVFFLTSILMALATMGLGLLYGNFSVVIGAYLLSAVLFGIMLATGTVLYQKNLLKKAGVDETTDDILNVKKKVEVFSSLDLHGLIERLKKDPVLGRMSLLHIRDGVRLTSEASWKSWGEIIHITREDSNDKFRYTVSSKPRLMTTLVDYGKGLENIKRVQDILED